MNPLLNPPDDETETETPDYQDIAESNGFTVSEIDGGFAIGDSQTPIYETEAECWQACCEENELIAESDDGGSWSNANGAWMLIEVFPADDDFDPADSDPWCKPRYQSLADCFGDEVLKLAAE